MRSHLLQSAAYAVNMNMLPSSMLPMIFTKHFCWEDLHLLYFRYQLHFLFPVAKFHSYISRCQRGSSWYPTVTPLWANQVIRPMNFLNRPVNWGCRIHILLLCSSIQPPSNECNRYNTKQSVDEVPIMLELWGMWTTPSLPSLSGPLWIGFYLWVK